MVLTEGDITADLDYFVTHTVDIVIEELTFKAFSKATKPVGLFLVKKGWTKTGGVVLKMSPGIGWFLATKDILDVTFWLERKYGVFSRPQPGIDTSRQELLPVFNQGGVWAI
jgi:hypothetical protein